MIASRSSSLRDAPVPSGSLLTGHLSDFARDPLDFLERTARRFGPVVRLRFGFRRACLLSDPDLIEEVLVTRNEDFVKSRAIRAQRPLLGNGLLLNEGDSWLRRRRLAEPAFHRRRIASYGETMVRGAERLAAGWEEGDQRDFHAEVRRLTSSVAARTLFGSDVDGEAGDLADVMDTAMEYHSDRRGVARLVPLWVPLPAHRRYRAAVRRLDAILLRLIRERRAGDDEHDDLLSMLLHARDEEGRGMSDEQLRDEVVNLFLGGYDTPALALSWIVYLLARHPEVEESLHGELDDVLDGRRPTVKDLSSLPYTEAVTREAMRLYPPAWLLGREAARDTVVGGYRIPAGTAVLFSQWVIHRDPRYFEEANRFRPERWLDGSAEQAPSFAYFPFGAGQRVCIGARFAEVEMVLVLATLARESRFLLATQSEVEPWPAITLRPRGGMPVVRRDRD